MEHTIKERFPEKQNTQHSQIHRQGNACRREVASRKIASHGLNRCFRRDVHGGFTLVEILVVVGVIAMLAGLLFPTFKRMQEGSYQASCMGNLKQIGVAVKMYYNDERRNPATLALLLPPSASIAIATGPRLSGAHGAPPEVLAGSVGYLSDLSAIKCPDDDTEWNVPTSSYEMALSPVWNFYGYEPKGSSSAPNNTPDSRLLVNPNARYSPVFNPVQMSLSNRYAPPHTIVTHCLFHRMPTSDVDDPEAIYDQQETSRASGAKDIILRLDGSAKAQDVSGFVGRTSGGAPNEPNFTVWQMQKK